MAWCCERIALDSYALSKNTKSSASSIYIILLEEYNPTLHRQSVVVKKQRILIQMKKKKMTRDIFNNTQQQQQIIMWSPSKPFRMRRRSLALASVIALTSAAATCSAFTATTSNVQHPSSPLLSVLNMVSFLEAPSSSSTRHQKQGRKDSSGKRLVTAERSTPSEARTTIEIDIPDYDAFVFDEYVVTTSSLPAKEKQKTSAAHHHSVPDIDNEILFEGISAADQRDSETPSSEISEVNDTASKVNRSSTMPGFIKDESLDSYIGNEALRRLPTKRKVSRMIRSKAAKLKRRQTNSEAMYRKSASVPDSLCDYAHEIHAISRVTPKEEKELGTKTQEAIRLKQMYDDLQGKYGREPTDEEWCAAAGKINMEALREAIQDGMEAKNLLVASNLRMVQRVVNLYIRNGLGSEYNAGDLMQDGTMVSTFGVSCTETLSCFATTRLIFNYILFTS